MPILDTSLSLVIAVLQPNPEAYGMLIYECGISHNIMYEQVPHSTVKKCGIGGGI